MSTEALPSSSSEASTSHSTLGSTAGAGSSPPSSAPDAAAPLSSETPPAGKPADKTPADPHRAAYKRAQERIAQQQTSSPSEQAGTAQPAASTQEAQPGRPGAAATSGQDTPAASTAPEAPQQWPESWRQTFEGLPVEGRQLALELNKSMQAGFTKAMQGISEIRKQADEYAGFRQQAEQDPRGFIENLARDLKLGIRFEGDPAPGDIPEFADAAEMAAWVAKQTAEQVRKELQARQDAEARQQAEQRTRQGLREEWKAAEGRFPDFGKHTEAVANHLRAAPELSVEQAYQLSTWGGLQQLATNLQKEVAELRQFKQQAERRAQGLTAPVGGVGPGTPDANANRKLSPEQRAMARAKARLSAAH